jgi:hypothetical protein
MYHCKIKSVPLSLGSAARTSIVSSEARTHIAQDESVEKINVTFFRNGLFNPINISNDIRGRGKARM